MRGRDWIARDERHRRLARRRCVPRERRRNGGLFPGRPRRCAASEEVEPFRLENLESRWRFHSNLRNGCSSPTLRVFPGKEATPDVGLLPFAACPTSICIPQERFGFFLPTSGGDELSKSVAKDAAILVLAAWPAYCERRSLAESCGF